MAAYPYYPVNYSSFYPASYQPIMQPQMVQQPSQPQMPVANQNPPASGIIWVSGMQEAQMYPVAPNNAVALWEQSGKVIYLKSADATGKPNMRVYDLVERADAVSTSTGSKEDKPVDYVTKEELSTVAVALKNVLGDIEQMKSDLYGVAGRKKSAKKPEVTGDDE